MQYLQKSTRFQFLILVMIFSFKVGYVQAATPSIIDNVVTVTVIVEHSALIEMHQAELRWNMTPLQQIHEGIDIANRVLINSNILDFSYEIKEVIYLNAWESTRQNDGYALGDTGYTNTNIAMAIARGNADRILFVTPDKYMRFAGGWANKWVFDEHDENNGSTLLDMKSRYVQIKADGLPTDALAHEFGHTLGLAHERDNEGLGAGTGFVDYATPYGYTSPNNVKTVMSYGSECPVLTGCSANLEIFSSPDIIYQGEPMGITAEYIDATDAAGFINKTWPLTTRPVRDLININITNSESIGSIVLSWENISGYDQFVLYKGSTISCAYNASKEGSWAEPVEIATLTGNIYDYTLPEASSIGCIYLEGIYTYKETQLRRPLGKRFIENVSSDDKRIIFNQQITPVENLGDVITIPFTIGDENILNDDIKLNALGAWSYGRGASDLVELSSSIFNDALSYNISGSGNSRTLTLTYSSDLKDYKPLFENLNYEDFDHLMLPFLLVKSDGNTDYKGNFYLSFRSVFEEVPVIKVSETSLVFGVNETNSKTMTAFVSNISDPSDITISTVSSDPSSTWVIDYSQIIDLGAGNYQVDITASAPGDPEFQYAAKINLPDYGIETYLNFIAKTWRYMEMEQTTVTADEYTEFYISGSVYNQVIAELEGYGINLSLLLENDETGERFYSETFTSGHSYDVINDQQTDVIYKAKVRDAGTYTATFEVTNERIPSTLHQFSLVIEPGIDSDNDGVIDLKDAFPNDPDESADSDGDGVGNNADLDDDNDGMSDVFEAENGLNSDDWQDALLDPDNDGLTNLEEFNAGTNPNLTDTDGDGLSDYDEVMNHGTNPTLADTDRDGMDDKYELDNNLNPTNINDGALDTDEDGLTNLEEFNAGINPNLTDTDEDGLSDYDEVKNHGTNPNLKDTDRDGMDDKYELDNGFDPLDSSDCPRWMCGSSKIWRLLPSGAN